MATSFILANLARNGPAGAAGVLVSFDDDPGTPLLLGASSVFAPAGAQPGDPLVDGKSGQAIAQLVDWTGLIPGAGFPNRANAALARPLVDVAGLDRFGRTPFASRRPGAGAGIATSGADGLRTGDVVDPSRECVMICEDQATGQVFRFGLSEQLVSSPVHAERDAGAPVFDQAGALVGIVVGAPAIETALGLPYTAVTPIDAIAQHGAWAGRHLLPFGFPASPKPATAAMPAGDRDRDTLARTMWGEARGEAATLDQSLAAVAWVVRNRRDANRPRSWGATVDEVCRKPWQFSCWNANDPNLAKMRAVTVQDHIFARAMEIGRAVLDGQQPDPTGGATHYHANGLHPAWSVGRQPSAVIGNHLFYAGVA